MKKTPKIIFDKKEEHYVKCENNIQTERVKLGIEAERKKESKDSNDIEKARNLCFKSLQCLYIAVEEAVANDINQNVKEYIRLLELQSQSEEKVIEFCDKFSVQQGV